MWVNFQLIKEGKYLFTNLGLRLHLRGSQNGISSSNLVVTPSR